MEGGDKGSRKIDPMLKLHTGRPVMINQNIDVEKSIANGAMCSFNGLRLKNGYEDCELINMDGCCVRCVDAEKVECMEVVLEEGDTRKLMELKPAKVGVVAEFPCPGEFDTELTHRVSRMRKRIQMCQFPINVANARTVHKL